MKISPFLQKRNFSDLPTLYRARFTQKVDVYASIAIPLFGYMAWPNDLAAREDGIKLLERWLDGYNENLNFRLISAKWGHVADIVSLHYALSKGKHQESRGGASVGKAIYLASRLIESRGAAQPSLWRHWQAYRDVAHLVAATILVCFDIQTRHRQAPFGLGLQELHPLRVVALLPDLIIGVALAYENYGVNSIAKGGVEPMFDPETIWRIPRDVNVEPVLPHTRAILPEEIVILNGRCAGNRGQAGQHKTTLISA